jgi:signal peptidase I
MHDDWCHGRARRPTDRRGGGLTLGHMMARPSRLRRVLVAATSVVLVAAGWFLFAPPILGGSAGYAIITGSSMIPAVHANDLVVLRAQPDYGVGDVVAYRSATLDRIVLHRIVGEQDGRVDMKGDHNSWTDVDHPSTGDLIGKEWFRIPELGGWLRRPLFVFAFVTGLLLAGVGLAAGGRRRRSSSSIRTTHVRPAGESVGRRAVALAGAAILAFTALGVVAFTTTVMQGASTRIVYRNTGSFEYRAAAPRGPVYPHGRVATGDPVYRKLVESVDASFAFTFVTTAPHAVGGTARLLAVVTDVNGWSRTIALGPITRFTGDEVVVRGRLDLPAIGELTDKVQALTGVVSGRYQLDLVPRVELSGTLAGKGLRSTFSPHLPFQLDPLQLLPSVPSGEAGGARAERFTPHSEGSVRARRATPSTLSAFGRTIDVVALRWLAVLGSFACLIGLVIALVRARRLHSWDEPRRIEARYGSLLVPVRDGLSASLPVEVHDMEMLVRLAEHYDHLILHAEFDGAHDYVVDHDGLAYRYRIDRTQPAFAATTDVPSEEPSGNGARSTFAGAPR